MAQLSDLDRSYLSRTSRGLPRFTLQLATLAGSVGALVIGGGLAWAQADGMPTEAHQASTGVSTEAVDLAPPAVNSAPVPPRQTAQSVDAVPPAAEPAPKPPEGGASAAPEPLPSIVYEEPETPIGNVPPGYSDVFIDPTEYSVGETANPDSPDVVFAERSTGCKVTLGDRSDLINGCESEPTDEGSAIANDDASGGINIGPVNISSQGITVGGTSIASREYYNRMLRPLNNLRQTAQAFIFPLATPAPITSLFGWRTHPIFGDTRFHSGTDLGAPIGTPVVASHEGQVVVSDYVGGYGFTVILRRQDGQQETLYGHLSRLLVQAGEWVDQGDVIGLVGSTGNSTGPHLHFEVRQLTGDGWIAVNPNELLQQTLVNFAAVLEHPLAALASQAEADQPEALDIPFRPAQPNAS